METLSIDLQGNYEQLNAMSDAARANLQSAGLDLKARLQELESIKKLSSARIEETADSLSHQSEMLGAATEEAVARLARVGESLTQRSAEATVASDLNAAKLTKVIDTFRAQADGSSAQAEQVSTALTGAADGLQRKLAAMATTYNQAEQGVESLSKALAKRAQELGSVTEVALGKAAAWDQRVSSHSDALTRITASVAQNASQVTQALDYQTTEMRSASNEANALLEALQGRKEETGIQDFINQASFISERLQSIAVDMSRVMETQISEDDWRRFNKGEQGIFVRKMLGFREKAKLASIRDKYQVDGEFRDYVTRYFSEFEVLLDESKKRDQEGLLKSIFLSSDVGKVYMLLARALGREIVAPDV